uniref:Uncharacterized protein n=1 Tax=Candidozyma auris TaxID=498019 RepID=A0A0L0NNS1_CANAR
MAAKCGFAIKRGPISIECGEMMSYFGKIGYSGDTLDASSVLVVLISLELLFRLAS